MPFARLQISSHVTQPSIFPFQYLYEQLSRAIMDKKGASALDRSSAAGSKHPHSYGYMGPHVLTVALPACSAMIPHLAPEL